MSKDGFKTATKIIKNSAEDFAAIASDLEAKDAKLNILFVSNEADFSQFSDSKEELFGANLIACSTAGEISSNGFTENTLVGVSLHGDEFLSDTIALENLDAPNSLRIDKIQESFDVIKEKHQKKLPGSEMFCILLIDGLSVKEEIVTGMLANVIENIPLIGGSAGDGLNFKSTKVFHKGAFRSNVATLTFVSTTRPFEIFKVQHFSETDKKIVITNSDPEKRIVHEIDGLPAAESYAMKLGIEINEFNPMTFSENPLMLKIGGEYYVRSIQKVNEDNSLTFYCAIDDGLVLTLAHRENLIDNAKHLFSSIQSKIGEIENCIMFECILRQLEAKGLPEQEKSTLIDIYKENNAVGFHTYGEQYGGLHINQTLTGVAFGKSRNSAA